MNHEFLNEVRYRRQVKENLYKCRFIPKDMRCEGNCNKCDKVLMN